MWSKHYSIVNFLREWPGKLIILNVDTEFLVIGCIFSIIDIDTENHVSFTKIFETPVCFKHCNNIMAKNKSCLELIFEMIWTYHQLLQIIELWLLVRFENHPGVNEINMKCQKSVA